MTDAPAPFRLSPQSRRIFMGLLLGMLVASISQTIVGPAMPRIVAELGGMDHYSWVATAAMLVSAISVPIVGKLSTCTDDARSTWPVWRSSSPGRSWPAQHRASGGWWPRAPSRASAWAF